MSKAKREVVKFRRNDHWRAVLSDTAPAELPIVVGNDGFYKNLQKIGNYGRLAQSLISQIILPGGRGKEFTIPYTYKIVKDEKSTRRLSLPHPRSQYEICTFYKDNTGLILHYCTKSPISLRRPAKEAGKYYITNPSENNNALKADKVTMLDVDLLEKNPASYYSYSGFNRLHQFFNSKLYNSLERQFSMLASLDIARCFDSIYTHSIAWATKSKAEAKETTRSKTFGGSFDRLMQSLNYNETNGIIIGPEASRIFAEIILNKIDADLIIKLENKELFFGRDYSCYRYVDNYYIFCNGVSIFNKIKVELQECLDYYKLHLNEEKTELINRPFFTRKSMAIYEADQLIKVNIDGLLEVKTIDDKKILVAKRIFRVSSLVKKFTTDLRKSCHVSGVAYDALANYILAAIKGRVTNIIDDYGEDGVDVDELTADNCIKFLEYSLEVSFHLFALNPTVTASLNISHLLIRCGEFLAKTNSDSFKKIREHVQFWVTQLSTSASFAEVVGRQHVTHVEILNVLIALKSFNFDGKFYTEILDRVSGNHNIISYFNVVTKLFIFGDDPKFEMVRKEIFYKAFDFIIEKPDLSECSERAHLLFDLLSCPYIDSDQRQKMMRKVIEAYNKAHSGKTIVVPTKAELNELITQFEASPWFASWSSVDLLRLIEKKQLKQVYP